MQVKHLDHLNLTVADFESSANWYHRVFGFNIVEKGVVNGQPWGILKAGEAMLCLYQHPELEPASDDSDANTRFHHINHFALRITDPSQWEKTVEKENVRVFYGGPVRWTHSTAWYVEDPSGYEIEVACWDNDRVSFN